MWTNKETDRQISNLVVVVRGKKLKPNLLVFTDCGSPAKCDSKQLDTIVNGLQQLEVQIKVMYVT